MNNTKDNKRIEWVDMLKGVAIICVIMGHRTYGDHGFLSKYLCAEIYSFHIPLFFFLSGIVFSINKYKSFKVFFIKKVKTILVPMICFSVAHILFNFVYYGQIVGIKKYDVSYLINRLVGIILQLRNGKQESILWFLPCLFISELLLYFIIKYTNNKTTLILICIFISFIVGMSYIGLKLPRLPWEIECALIALFFVGLGYLLKKIKSINKKANRIILLPILIALNVITMYLNYIFMKNNSVDLAYDKIGMPLWYLIESVTGIWALVIIFSRMRKLKPLSYIGRNSLVYYCLLDLMVFIPDIIIFNILHINLRNFGDWSVIINIVYTAIVCVSIVPVNELISRKLKFLKGQF